MSVRPSTCPGCRAPHVWLDDGSALYDHFGPDFTLLASGDVEAGIEARLQQQAEQAGVPVRLLAVTHPLVSALYPTRYTLIRPDQHVAWRGDDWSATAVRLLRQVAGFELAVAPRAEMNQT